MSGNRKCYYCDKPLKPMPPPMSESAAILAGHDFGLGDITVPPETCPHCGHAQPGPSSRQAEAQKPETD